MCCAEAALIISHAGSGSLFEALALGRPLLAVVQFQKFLNASPSPKGYRELAEVYQKLSRERNATEALAKAENLENGGGA